MKKTIKLLSFRLCTIALIAALFAACTSLTYAQTNIYDEHLCAGNEQVLISFKMKKSGKTLSVLIAKDESYIVYRYGIRNNIELEFPESKADSWGKFTYYHEYYAGGGHDFRLSFVNGGFTYDICDQYFKGGEREVWIEITDKNNKTTNLEGDPMTAIGFLTDIGNYNVNDGGSSVR